MAWDDERGFGFIAPSGEERGGGRQTFVHISSFPRGRRPRVGTTVTYVAGRDDRGRSRAHEVQYAGRQPRGALRRGVVVSLVVLAAWAALLVGLHLADRVGPLELAALGLVNVVTFVAFALDKSAARKGARRTPESTLLLLSLLGGWPSGLVARHTLRHKTVKEPFRTSFWCAVMVSCAALAAWVTLRP